MTKDPMDMALTLINRFAGSEWADRLGLRKPAESLLYHSTRTGFQAIRVATRQFRAITELANPLRMERPPHEADRFDLTLSDEQQMIRETMQRFAEDVMKPLAREADREAGPPEEFLNQAQELGINLINVPEALGGAGATRSTVTNALIAEDLARGDMALALAVLAPLGVVNALVDWGSPEQQARYLPAFVEDTFLPAAFALAEPRALFDPMRLDTCAEEQDSGYLLNGEKCMVPLAGPAQLFLVAADIPGKGPGVFIVERSAEGLTVTADPTMGLCGAGLGRVSFEDVALPSEALLGGEDKPLDFRALVDLSRIGWGALAAGAGQAVLDYVIPYCNDRQAFGEPISHRQAVAFMIANIGIEVEGMRLMVYRAASRAEQGRDFHREAYLARLQCGEKGMGIGTDGVQLLGGHGFTQEYPVELWYRHLRGAGIVEGGLLV